MPARVEQAGCARLHTPERRAQVARRALVRRVEPQHPGDVGSLDRPFVQRDEGDEPLRKARQPHRAAVADDLERVQQAELHADGFRRTGRAWPQRWECVPQGVAPSLVESLSTLERRRARVNPAIARVAAEGVASALRCRHANLRRCTERATSAS